MTVEEVKPSGKSHELKCWPVFFSAVARGEKTFEVRHNDRGYGVGDVVHLREFDPDMPDDAERFTGRECRALVTYMTDFHQHPNWVVLSIRLIP